MSRDAAARGARARPRSGATGLWRAWWHHHYASAWESFGRLADTPVQTLLTALVVAIAVALPAALLLTLINVQRLGGNWDSGPQMTVYLQLQASAAEIDTLQQRLRTAPEVQELEYLSPEQALQQFQAQSGFSEAIAELADNPLPPTLVLTPATGDPATLENLRQRLLAESSVDDVTLDMDWVQRLHAIMIVGRQLVLGLAGLLGLGVLLLIGNTIRLEIESRRDEIVVIKLVGGTDGFVRRPFLYTGAWYGLIGGLLACLLVSTCIASLSDAVHQLAAAYQSQFWLQGLGLSGCVLLIFGCVLLGLVGAWLAVGRHLRAVEPR